MVGFVMAPDISGAWFLMRKSGELMESPPSTLEGSKQMRPLGTGTPSLRFATQCKLRYPTPCSNSAGISASRNPTATPAAAASKKCLACVLPSCSSSLRRAVGAGAGW